MNTDMSVFCAYMTYPDRNDPHVAGAMNMTCQHNPATFKSLWNGTQVHSQCSWPPRSLFMVQTRSCQCSPPPFFQNRTYTPDKAAVSK